MDAVANSNESLDVTPVWKRLCAMEEIPRLGSRVVKSAAGDLAVFRTAEDEVFALHDKCPHKGGPLSQGIVHGRSVTCPLHSWKIDLASGQAQAPDVGCSKPFRVKVEDGMVWLALG
ncbi:nitrite reductase (NAD(P)H) small subunit [Denitratisoma sp. DHT3]|uniref:nitrite reductase small subunit NirD n=1 Tax=Denitratisoma sp. DHT3 TaxID=1981880 RepID=UPI001198A58C|nr:nitrite reductase small subunit NirD [Denitratisoma sp. DHT3]QDX80019.1 nitrite reductase (NAD(P)H) small subunit [Denitratisoma sp. DHT3]